jgi:hypothetical protein
MSRTPLEKEENFILKIANVVIAATWIYHGIIPKLMFMETGELDLIHSSALFPGIEEPMVYLIGIAETLFGLSFIMFHRKRILHFLNIIALVFLAVMGYILDPYLFLQPFNPFTTSLGPIGLSLISLHLLKFIKNKD